MNYYWSHFRSPQFLNKPLKTKCRISIALNSSRRRSEIFLNPSRTERTGLESNLLMTLYATLPAVSLILPLKRLWKLCRPKKQLNTSMIDPLSTTTSKSNPKTTQALQIQNQTPTNHLLKTQGAVFKPGSTPSRSHFRRI